MTTTNTFGVTFFLKKNRTKNEKAPLYLRITVDGKRVEVALKTLVDPNKWNGVKGAAKGQTEEAKSLNFFLENIRGNIINIYQDLQIKKKQITAVAIKNKYCGTEEKEHTLMSLFDFHNNELKSSLKWGTMKNYYTTRKYVLEFLKEKRKTSDMFLEHLNNKFVFDFERFLKERTPDKHQKPCGQNGTMKHIERLRKVVNLAIRNEYIEKDPFMKFKSTFIHKNREFLTAEELHKIEDKQYSIVRMQHVRDLFVFSCYTGLAYIDAYNLTPHNIGLGIDGEYWITTSRVKSDQPVRIPLLPKAMEIVERYKHDPIVIASGKLLPSLSNQRLNSYLKEIADSCNIEKPLTFHIARHTFATTVTLANGVPIETVSKLLGHTSIKTTQIYAKVIEKKVSEDMSMLKAKLNVQSKSKTVNQ
jgi:integrase/recombinase XerD